MSLVKHRVNLVPCALGWSDAVPQSWRLMPCRAIVEEKSAKNENSKNQNYLSLMANVGVIPYEEKGDVGNKKPEDLSKCKLVSKGDLVINSMNYGIGSYGLSSLDGVCSPVYIVLKPRPSVVHERYALRIFESKSFQKYAQSFGVGILEHRAAIGWDDLKNIKVGIPSLEEQQWLLDYLDRETTRIDALITKKTRFIELLREKRQALITHAVTKGLDPNVKMKDSGVEWLGEVPEHWEIKGIGYILDAVGDVDHLMPESVEKGIPYLMTGDLEERASLVRLEDCKQVSHQDYVKLSKRIKSSKGDVILARYATIGTSMYVDIDAEFLVSYSCVTIKTINSKVSGLYLFQYLKSDAFYQGMKNQINTNTQDNVGIDDLTKVKIALPSPPEQEKIIEFISGKLKNIDGLTEKTERSIELLKERRSALITAAVTGQIDLREAA